MGNALTTYLASLPTYLDLPSLPQFLFQHQQTQLKLFYASHHAPLHKSQHFQNITMDLKTRYKEKVIESVIKIHTDEKGERIVGVEDRWNGNIPEGAIATAFRNLNSVVVPAFVSVPKEDGENK